MPIFQTNMATVNHHYFSNPCDIALRIPELRHTHARPRSYIGRVANQIIAIVET